MTTPGSRPLALITGASSGIGQETARELARRGWRTILLARREELLRELAEELSPLAPSAVVTADLAQPDGPEKAASHILETHGPIDALVNNAGFGIYATFLRHAPQDHARLMQVNYFAPLALIRAFLPAMLARGHGRIVNISSMSAKIGPWGHSGYAASKAALRAMTESLDAEYRAHGVRFSCVFPGIIATPYFMNPGMSVLFRKVQRYAISPQRCARLVANVVERPRIWACVPWHYRILDALGALSPTLAHRIVARSSRAADAAAAGPPPDRSEATGPSIPQVEPAPSTR
jgi:short-subunit dehydrogenase